MGGKPAPQLDELKLSGMMAPLEKPSCVHGKILQLVGWVPHISPLKTIENPHENREFPHVWWVWWILMTPPRSVSPPEGIWATHGPLHLALASPPAKGSWEQFHLARVHPQMAILPGKMKENKIYPSKSSIVSDKPNFASRIQSTLRSWRQCSAGGPGPKTSTRTLWSGTKSNKP